MSESILGAPFRKPVKSQTNIRTEAQRKAFLDFWSKVELEDGYTIEWAPYKKARTLRQNRLLWASAYGPIAEHLSEQSGKVITREMVHEVAKDRFSPVTVVELNGKAKSYPRSTTTFTVEEFKTFLDRVYQWGAEMGVFFNQDDP